MSRIVVLVLALVLFSPIATAWVPDADPEIDPMQTRFDYLSANFEPGWEDTVTSGDMGAIPRSSRAVETPTQVVQNEIGRIVDNVSSEYLQSYLTTLQNFGSRFYRAPSMKNATKWIHDALVGNDRLEVEYHNFTIVNSMGTHNIANVVMTLPGINESSDHIYYMYAHSDSVQSDNWPQILTNAPGADDDGSGTVSVIEAARVLSKFKFHDTIKFLLVTAEEIGLVGSYYYVQNVSSWGENVQGGIDYDMIGYSSGTQATDLDLISNPASAWQRNHLVDVNDRYDIGLSIATYQTSSSIPSDIWRFYQNGYPSVMGIESEFSPVYHTTQDRLRYINWTLLTRTTQLAVAALSEMARLIYVDVTPGNLTISNDKPVEDELIEVNVTINNSGNLNATDLEVEFYEDGFAFASKRINVPANGTNITNATWIAKEGNHVISVVLDPTNEIPETDETNNSVYITVGVNDRPRAVLTAKPMIVFTNETVFFNGTFSSDDVGGIADYLFSFGDGNSSGWIASPTISHQYIVDGAYQASLQVRDSEGATSDISETIIQVLNRDPVASPLADPTRTLTFVDIQFTSNAEDPDGTVTVNWDFGDNTTSNLSDPIHNYSKKGVYEVTLEIVDDDGASASYSLEVVVDNRLPICVIEADEVYGNISTQFTFEAVATDEDGTIVSYEWDLEDGTTSEMQLVEHMFERPGTYTIRLTVRDDDGGEDRDLVNITIEDLPPIAIASMDSDEIYTFGNVIFTGDDSHDLEGPVTCAWDFGDGNTSTEINPVHSYWRPGEFIPSLVVKDNAGQTDNATLPAITVLNRLPNADFRVFGNFTEKETVYFDATKSSDPESDLTFNWDFGDGETGTGAVADHVFPGPGNYTVNLTVTDADGGEAKASKVVTVKKLPPPKDPPQQPKPQDPDDEDSLTDLLMSPLGILVIILIVLLIISIAWGYSRGKKKVPSAGPPPEEGPPIQQEPSAYTESPVEQPPQEPPPEEQNPSEPVPEPVSEEPPGPPADKPLDEPVQQEQPAMDQPSQEPQPQPENKADINSSKIEQFLQS
jgi:PKD repeat protein